MEQDTTTVVEPRIVGARLDTILVFEALKHMDLQFIMNTTGSDTILPNILNSINDFQNLMKYKTVVPFRCGPFDPI